MQHSYVDHQILSSGVADHFEASNSEFKRRRPRAYGGCIGVDCAQVLTALVPVPAIDDPFNVCPLRGVADVAWSGTHCIPRRYRRTNSAQPRTEICGFKATIRSSRKRGFLGACIVDRKSNKKETEATDLNTCKIHQTVLDHAKIKLSPALRSTTKQHARHGRSSSRLRYIREEKRAF